MSIIRRRVGSISDTMAGIGHGTLKVQNCFIMFYRFPNNNNNNNHILYLDILSREETLFKGVYIGSIIGYTN